MRLAVVDEELEDVTREPFALREPLPEVITTEHRLREYAHKLADGQGPLALDAERASGFTYSQRAYLIQLRREGSGTALIDPTSFRDLSLVQEATVGLEWILHAATQDLDCLREVGMHPSSLFDTELAGRLLGRERVGLAALIDVELGAHLEKGHGAANWSMRPLTNEMLKYAALDVELLVELRDSLATDLHSTGKWEYAQQEFTALLSWKPRAQTGEGWRRTSGVHALKTPLGRGIARELWITRDDIARRRDIAPGRILPDRAIVAAAASNPSSVKELMSTKEFNGRGAKRYEHQWFSAIERARNLGESELPGKPPRGEGPPPPRAWADKNPDAFARLEYARAAISELSERIQIPMENVLQPDLLRRLCWNDPIDSLEGLAHYMRQGGARDWQIELTSPILTRAFDQRFEAELATEGAPEPS